MGLIFITILALLEPSSFAIAIAVIAPAIICIGGFFYARAPLFIASLTALSASLCIGSLSPEVNVLQLYNIVLTTSKAADVLAIISLALSALQGYLIPNSNLTCFKVIQVFVSNRILKF